MTGAALQPRTGALLVTLALAPLLLVHLGASALWDDEANTAIFAANVWKTGDTNAFDGTNIIAFRGGLELAGIKNRAYPPLQYFYAAPFVGLRTDRTPWLPTPPSFSVLRRPSIIATTLMAVVSVALPCSTQVPGMAASEGATYPHADDARSLPARGRGPLRR